MRRSSLNVALIVFGAGFLVAVTLVVVLLRNPATHANLEDPKHYDRTEIVYLGEEYAYWGYAAADGQSVGERDVRRSGHDVFVVSGCAGCHGLYAQGGAVGGTLWDVDPEDVGDFVRVVRDAPGGMPDFAADVVSDDDLELILSFLAAAPSEATALGVTTTTTTLAPRVDDRPVTEPGEGEAPSGEGQPPTQLVRELEAPSVETIEVDGDIADWDGIPALDLLLEPILEEDAEPRDASVRVAHDEEFLYVLFTVDDDFNWSDVDPHFSGAPAVMWPVDTSAGPHMGGDDPSGHPALGMVDIWYWRLDCPIGVESGGAVSGPGDADPGNDDACNLDDEWATDPETHDDDVGPGAENSLLGVFSHTNPVEDAPGTWYFELRRPLQTGDPSDAQFVVGGTSRLALAYWDPDAGQLGWGRRNHVQSSNGGWIDVSLLG